MEIYLSAQHCIPHFIINSRDGLVFNTQCSPANSVNKYMEGILREVMMKSRRCEDGFPNTSLVLVENGGNAKTQFFWSVHIWSFSELIAVVHRLRVKNAFVSLKHNLLRFIFLFHESCIWIYGGEKTPSNTFLWQYVKFWDWNVKICVSTKKAMETKCFPLPWDFFWQTVSSAKFRWKKPQVGAHCKL